MSGKQIGDYRRVGQYEVGEYILDDRHQILHNDLLFEHSVCSYNQKDCDCRHLILFEMSIVQKLEYLSKKIILKHKVDTSNLPFHIKESFERLRESDTDFFIRFIRFLFK